ncbi:hypothetical protein [Pelosinus propionicus]|nr:hypothetical protein [Pelosinus propionicus]
MSDIVEKQTDVLGVIIKMINLDDVSTKDLIAALIKRKNEVYSMPYPVDDAIVIIANHYYPPEPESP